jgi:hypothetical protein
VYVASLARCARLLEIALTRSGLIWWYETLSYDVEAHRLKPKATWTRKKGDRFTRRTSMAM